MILLCAEMNRKTQIREKSDIRSRERISNFEHDRRFSTIINKLQTHFGNHYRWT